MKNIYKMIFVALLASTYGCEKFLDVNENEDKVRAVSMQLSLPGAQASMAATFGGSFHNLGGFWSQYYTQSPDAGQYEDFDAYVVSTDFFDGEWSEVYTGALVNLRNIKNEANASGATSYALVATLCEAYTFQMLSDLYDKIPYSEALAGGDNTKPKFDNGEDVYKALIAEIDASVAAYEANPSADDLSSADMIFNGDMSQWIGFANTLKLKMYMRQSYTASPKGTEIMALLSEDNFITSDAAFSSWTSEQGKRNPYFEVQVDRLGDVNGRASNTLLSYLLDSEDPRIDEIYTPGSSGHKAKPQGDYANRDIPNGELSKPLITALTPVYFMTMSELHFLKAEALVRYSGASGAQGEYEAGIDASFASHGLGDGSSLYASGGAYEWNDAGSEEDKIGQIMMQKWVSMANQQNLEAFFEMNRTQYPPLSSAAKGTEGAIGERTLSYASTLTGYNTPRRLDVPDVEVSRNAKAPASTGIAAKVWWDRK
mgnify:FL=1